MESHKSHVPNHQAVHVFSSEIIGCHKTTYQLKHHGMRHLSPWHEARQFLGHLARFGQHQWTQRLAVLSMKPSVLEEFIYIYF
jgi:hypothetical protein